MKPKNFFRKQTDASSVLANVTSVSSPFNLSKGKRQFNKNFKLFEMLRRVVAPKIKKTVSGSIAIEVSEDGNKNFSSLTACFQKEIFGRLLRTPCLRYTSAG
jgi:hypothetical protein